MEVATANKDYSTTHTSPQTGQESGSEKSKSVIKLDKVLY